jgi:hypothetical protein
MASENSLRLTSKNTMSLEQITNEILPLEIAEKTGRDLKNDAIIEELRQKHDISDSMVKMFRTGAKRQKVKKKKDVKKTSNLERLIRTQYKDEIPEQYREDFLKYILKLGDKKFDFEKCEYPIDEFGDNIVKSLYLWDPEGDPVISKNYKKFFLKVEEEIMDRNLILAKIKSEETTEFSSDWDFLSQ